MFAWLPGRVTGAGAGNQPEKYRQSGIDRA